MVTYAITLSPALDWLPDDTEEAILGASSHQTVIAELDTGLTWISEDAVLPWFIGNQLKMLIPRQSGGSYQPSPDILVHPTLGPRDLTSLPIAQLGPPALIIEVASPSTARDHDLNTLEPHAKPQAYAECGVLEYLVFDPTGFMLPSRVRAWQRGPAGTYDPWLPDADGRWHSQALGISFAPEPRGVLLRLYDRAGQLVPSRAELRLEARELRQETRALRQETHALKHDLTQQTRDLNQTVIAQRQQIAASAARIAALEAELRRRSGSAS